MSDTATITCSDCNTEQPQNAPFCQNCGSRLRSPETLREPMKAISDADLRQPDETDDGKDEENIPETTSEISRPSRINRSDSRSSSSPPKRQMVSPSESSPGTLDEQTAPPRSESGAGGSDTVFEGMEAVSGDPADTYTDAPTPSADDDPADEADTQRRTTRRLPVDSQRSELRWIVGGAIVGCIAIVAGLSWLHIERQAGESDPVEAIETEVIEIEAGPFRRGLTEDAEAFILDYCFRYHDDPENDCDRERLLDGEYPTQTVDMPSYGIDSTPVLTGDYTDCVDDGACQPIAYDDCDVWTPKGLQIGVRVPDILRRDDRPVVCVDRDRAGDYCDWNGGNLPTHNQWEKAARGDETPLFPWGDRWKPDRANWGESDVMQVSVAGELDGYAWTSPPGAFPEGRSPKGLDDMAGNVAEWVRGDDPLVGHVRGGSWVSNPFELRTTARDEVEASSIRTDIGFRCTYPAE